MQFMVGGGATIATIIWILTLIFPWLKYDFSYLKMMAKLYAAYRRCKKKNKFVIDLFEDWVKVNPHKTFLIFEEKRYSYEQMNENANKVANAALSIGIKKGDAIAMLQYNEPDFLWTYFG